MPTTLDHLVWAGPDLASLVARATELFGFAPVEGGPHPGRGTRNYLVGLGPGRYLELLGPDPEQPRPEQPRPFGVDDLTEDRLQTWAVRTDDMAATLARARAHGYDPGEAGAMSRTRPDGVELNWQLTASRPGEAGLDRIAPFVIDWLDSPHPSDGLPTVRLEGLLLQHPDHERLARVCAALELDTAVSVEPGGPAIGATLAIGPTSITI